ncbi:type I restriction enzyme S subunit [Ereboglobus sp. PH5-5]|uniref:restriction endonuclease subunit S n=1 Tax=unclassified Ereboglobus TaxID=2626932 RepID=UPI002404DC18|nr:MULTISPECIES: restriction endonuclease subunit S [unclassified Ereboglobus]MDF9828598.1 type I restriction enzyme S subunit [Ereboglobus sp. PH5-10]MDF9834405.1 type I restriction enzyme S subunit [Ereboglobus sp. PH5-5]
MSFPKYPNYKPSGVDWLGDVPAHWEVSALKRCFQILGGSTPKSENDLYWDGNIPWATPADLSKLPSIYIYDTQRKITQDGLNSCNTSLAPAGSIILSTRAPIGSLAIAGIPMSTNQGCKTLVPRADSNSKFFAYLLSISTKELNIRGKGTTFLELSADELGSFGIPFPPLPEQTQIAEFLDRETGKIDALVAEQRRLMELLKEKRQAVISQAVTRGLNPQAPLKPSGIPWLGDVPAHWEVKALKHLATLTTGITPPTEDRDNYADDEGFPWIRPEDLDESGKPTHASKFLTEKGWGYVRHIKPFSTLICCIGTIGKLGFTDCSVSTNQQITAAEFQQCSRYFYYALQSAKTELEVTSTGNVLRILNTERLGNIRFAAPPRKEADEIAGVLDTATAKFGALIAEAQCAIDLLQERRTALISAAVTGQIDAHN